MNWKNLWNKNYALVVFYALVLALLYHLGVRILDHFPELGEHLQNLFPWASQVISPLLLGFAIAYLLSPICHFFERILSKNALLSKKQSLCQNISILMTFLLLILGVVFLGSLLLSTLTKSIQVLRLEDLFQGIEDFASTVEKFYSDLYVRLGNLPIGGEDAKEAVQLLLQKAVVFFQNMGNSVFSSLGSLAGALSTLVFGIIFSLYFLADGQKILSYWARIFRLLFGERRLEKLRRFFVDADRVFAGYLRGQIIDGTIMAVLVSVSLSVLQVRYAVVIGVLTGFGNLIPYVGPFIAYGLTALVCLVYGDFTKLLPALIALFVIQTVDGNVINPRLLSQNIDVHPLVVIISLIIGGSLGGFLGIFLAAPVASLIKLELDKFMEQKLSMRREEVADISEEKTQHMP
ncbi:MAG: AI-2E family transporter [Oribacterium parvum]|uniref:AI-2E family transporter n=1 Tax=Oribacterium parvum TaxID=1501329 RepID=UPI001CAC1448|nr:AI-2E family transporter [Oribacterium parvum]MBF1267954.1 AI-2E family transporter [Oribacterium parvum]